MSRVRWCLVPLLLILFAVGVHVHGVLMTPDSVEYVAMARALAEGRGAHGFDGEPSAIWPPGFSVVLAPWIAVGLDPRTATVVCTALLGSLLVPFVLWPLARRLRAPAWRTALIVGIVAGVPIVTVATALLADALLVAIVLATLLAATRTLESRSSTARPWMLALAAIAPVVKLTGLMVWPAVALALWLRSGPRGLVRLVPVPLPLIAWVLRNGVETGQLVEAFPGDPRPLEPTVRRTLEHFARWFVPQIDSTDVLLIMAAVLATALVTVWVRRGRPAPPAGDLPWIVALAGFLALLWIGSTRQRIDLPDHRLLAPAYAVTVVLAARLGDALQRGARRPHAWTVVAITWTLWLAFGGIRAVRSPLFAERADDYAPDGAVARSLAELEPLFEGASTVWCNVPEYLYWHTGRRTQWPTPEHVATGIAPDRPVVFVWFTRSAREGLVRPEDLGAVVDWRERSETNGVVAWRGRSRLSPRAPDAPPARATRPAPRSGPPDRP
jgi:hypothetical protein